MHEMSLAEGIRSIVEQAAHEHGANRVATIVVQIGQLAAVEVDALQFCLESVLQGSIAEGARVEVENVAGTGCCRDCGATMPIATLYEPCVQCGSYRVQATGGTEMRVKALEME
jgi:hydrogenase nickel incorporation protein HypA/HybF